MSAPATRWIEGLPIVELMAAESGRHPGGLVRRSQGAGATTCRVSRDEQERVRLPGPQRRLFPPSARSRLTMVPRRSVPRAGWSRFWPGAQNVETYGLRVVTSSMPATASPPADPVRRQRPERARRAGIRRRFLRLCVRRRRADRRHGVGIEKRPDGRVIHRGRSDQQM